MWRASLIASVKLCRIPRHKHFLAYVEEWLPLKSQVYHEMHLKPSRTNKHIEKSHSLPQYVHQVQLKLFPPTQKAWQVSVTISTSAEFHIIFLDVQFAYRKFVPTKFIRAHTTTFQHSLMIYLVIYQEKEFAIRICIVLRT